jgi:23S rRNA (pseudouridine1915-N3)-methyltransferase
MKITILAVGKARTDLLDSAIIEYEKRLSRWTAINWQFVPTSTPDKESEQLMKILADKSQVILLDERGQAKSTTDLAKTLEDLQNQSVKDIVFVIGGAHGVNPAVRARANQTWKLSDMIFPHELVRLILIEQLYRAYDINHAGKYHHAD